MNFIDMSAQKNPFLPYLHKIKSFPAFLKELQIELHWQQEQAAQAYMTGYNWVACRSGQGPGKTFLFSLIALHYALTNHNAKVIITGPTFNQCKTAFMGQAKKHIEKRGCPDLLKRLYEFTGSGFKCHGKKEDIWGAMIRTSKDGDRIRGMHERNMMIIFEEASGVDDDIWTICKGTCSGPFNKLYAVGNPSTRREFYNCFYGPTKHLWYKLHWNAEETPESQFFTQDKNRRMAEEYGKDSDVYRVNILGEFPEQDADSLVGTDQVLSCMDLIDHERSDLQTAGYNTHSFYRASRPDIANTLDPVGPDGKIRKQFGIDYARFGGDENVVYQVLGNDVINFWKHDNVSPHEANKQAIQMQRALGWKDKDCVYVADASGMGQGVIDGLYEAGKQVMEFHNGGRATYSTKYHDTISEAYDEVAHLIKKQKVGLNYDKELPDQLAKRCYLFDNKGRIALEAKKEYKRREGSSPDRADALVMALYPHAWNRVNSAQVLIG